MRHGGRPELLRLAPRADELAQLIREVVPIYAPADEAVIRLLAVTLARVERAVAALDKIDEAIADDPLRAYAGSEAAAKTLERLRADCRGWINTSKRLTSELGMTPASRAKLGLDTALARRALSLVELTEQAAEEMRSGGGDW